MTVILGSVYNDGDSATSYSGDAPHAIIVRSPNGHCWQIKIDNTGTISTTDLGIL